MALDRKAVESMAQAARAEIERLNHERAVTEEALRGLEAWLGAQRTQPRAQDGAVDGKAVDGKAKRDITMRSAVLQVIHESRNPMKTSDILERAQAMGARTTAKKPSSIVALILNREKDVVQVAPATYMSTRA